MFGSTFWGVRIDFDLVKIILPIFYIFSFRKSKSIITFKINFRKSENFLLSVKITFRGTNKHKSFYFKINSNQINFNKINSI